MPLQTRRSQASTTMHVFGHSTEPLGTEESNSSPFRRSNPSQLRSFRVIPSYPSPQRRREISSNAPSSSFRTSYVMAEESSDSESDVSTVSDRSRAFWREKTLMRGNFRVDDSSDSESIASVASDTVTNCTYDSIHFTKLSKTRKEAYKFSVEGTGAISCILASRADQCWIARFNDKVLHMYHRNGHKKEAKSVCDKINMMCIRQDKTLLVVPQMSNNVYTMSSSGKMSSILSFEIEIGGICSTNRNEILVALTPTQKSQKRGPKPRTLPSVLRIAQDGTVVWKIKTKGTDPFVKPSKVAVNVNGDICVLDIEPSKSHLVILTPDGEEKKRYYGVQDKVLTFPFEPKDICCDKKGFIFVADLRNSAIHVLDQNGNFHHFMFTRHDGNQFPCAITTDCEGFVWVGLSSGTVCVYRPEQKKQSV